MTHWLLRNVNEIGNDRALLFYGAALALVNAVVALFWLISEPVAAFLAPGSEAVCWPFFESCYTVRVVPTPGIAFGVAAFGGLSLVNAWAFWEGRRPMAAYTLLACLTLLKCGIIAQDYRLIHNQHYMANWATFCYLFVPQKRTTLPVLLVSFYVWAGSLKFNGDWLSGMALLGRRPLGVPAALVPVSCAYVVVLETVIVWGVLARRQWVFLAALSQLLLFHVVSFSIVGYFYPLVMFLLLSVLVLIRQVPWDNGTGDGPHAWWRSPRAAVMVAFALAQLLPRAYAGDSAITGQGRMFALHMFDAPVQCESTLTFGAGMPAQQVRRLRPRWVNSRLACDPLVHFELARAYCRNHDISSSDTDFDLKLRSRRHSERTYRVVVDIRGFCGEDLRYRLLGNPWIQARQSAAVP